MTTMSRSFEAKYGGVCGSEGCHLPIEKGEMVHFIGEYGKGVLAHEHCHGLEGPMPEDEGDWHGDGKYLRPRLSEDTGGYRVRGRRDHEKPCPTCFLTHSGECL